MGHRFLAFTVATVLLTSCTTQGVGSVTADADAPAPSAIGITNATEPETLVTPVDLTSCQTAVSRVREWTDALLLAGATFKTIVDLSDAAIPSTFPDERAMDAGESMFDAAELYTQKVLNLEPLLQNLITVASDCRDSDAFAALPVPCGQAVIAALEPERSRASVWTGPGIDYLTTLLDTVSAWLSSGFRLTLNQRAELASAERRALGLNEEMLREAAHIRSLAMSCRI
jgi:hypothetical protein